jgi:hypothetical protein
MASQMSASQQSFPAQARIGERRRIPVIVDADAPHSVWRDPSVDFAPGAASRSAGQQPLEAIRWQQDAAARHDRPSMIGGLTALDEVVELGIDTDPIVDRFPCQPGLRAFRPHSLPSSAMASKALPQGSDPEPNERGVARE